MWKDLTMIDEEVIGPPPTAYTEDMKQYLTGKPWIELASKLLLCSALPYALVSYGKTESS